MRLTECVHENTIHVDSERCGAADCIVEVYICKDCGTVIYEHSCGAASHYVES